MELSIFSSYRYYGLIIFTAANIVVQLMLTSQLYFSFGGRGVASWTTARAATSSVESQIPYRLLASVIQDKFSRVNKETRLDSIYDESPTVFELTKTLSKLASNQQTFKGLDGVAHEAYQRTRTLDEGVDTSISGRAQRSAARLAAVAEALYACELVEIAENPDLFSYDLDDADGILHNKDIILNVTLGAGSSQSERNPRKGIKFSLSVLVIHEPQYTGEMGLEHGSILSLTKSTSSENEQEKQEENGRGRLLIVLGQKSPISTTKKITLLDDTPKKIKLASGLVTNEVASVQPELYERAGELLALLEPQLRQYNTTCIHFVGHSLAGGVASLAATILDGSIPMPKKILKRKPRKTRHKKGRVKTEKIDMRDTGNFSNCNSSKIPSGDSDDQESVYLEPLSGFGRARSSAVTLGSPPCLSSNVLAAFCTSFIHGDDIICRTTEDSLSRLKNRIEKIMHSGFIGKKLGWMSDTVSLTVTSLQNHAHGSEGEEMRLAVPGRAFLVRPRRLGGICSIHEVGNLKKGGREALREALLWQLNDVLLSTSMWRHHDLKSYIKGLDRTQLRGFLEN